MNALTNFIWLKNYLAFLAGAFFVVLFGSCFLVVFFVAIFLSSLVRFIANFFNT